MLFTTVYWTNQVMVPLQLKSLKIQIFQEKCLPYFKQGFLNPLVNLVLRLKEYLTILSNLMLDLKYP